MLNDILTWMVKYQAGVGILSTLVATTAALFSAFSAWRTRKSAELMAVEIELRSAAIDAKSISIEFEALEQMGFRIKQSNETLAIFTNNQNNSRVPLITNDVFQKLDKLKPLKEEADVFNSSYQKYETNSSLEIAKIRRSFTLSLIEIRETKNSFSLILDDLNSQIRIHQSKLINRT